MEGVLASTPTPSGNSSLVPFFSLKNGLLKPSSPLEFPLTFLGAGMDIFWNYTIQLRLLTSQY